MLGCPNTTLEQSCVGCMHGQVVTFYQEDNETYVANKSHKNMDRHFRLLEILCSPDAAHLSFITLRPTYNMCLSNTQYRYIFTILIIYKLLD